MAKQLTKAKRLLLAGTLVLSTFAVALGGYYSSNAYHFEIETGAPLIVIAFGMVAAAAFITIKTRKQ